jgi:hypothetical protein
VRHYRVYCLDGAGRVGLAEWIQAADDDEAIRQAHELKPSARKCEVWLRDRLVASIWGQADRLADEIDSPVEEASEVMTKRAS